MFQGLEDLAAFPLTKVYCNDTSPTPAKPEWGFLLLRTMVWRRRKKTVVSRHQTARIDHPCSQGSSLVFLNNQLCFTKLLILLGRPGCHLLHLRSFEKKPGALTGIRRGRQVETDSPAVGSGRVLPSIRRRPACFASRTCTYSFFGASGKYRFNAGQSQFSISCMSPSTSNRPL